jgi:RNA polymerase sigma-70 factor (ECF subfamily)
LWKGRGDRIEAGTFEEFFAGAERQVRYALVALYGFEVGREAAADALAYAWEHWPRIAVMENPAGYVYRVGQRLGRRMARRREVSLVVVAVEEHPTVEPGLERALAQLSPGQRVAVVLVHGLGHTQREAARLMGVSASTVQTHLERALARLRAELGVDLGR